MENKKAKLLIESLRRAPPGPCVEIGCIRESREVVEDGFSTPYLSRECIDQGRTFYSFDTEQKHVDIANNVLKMYGHLPVVKKMDGKKGIKLVHKINPCPIAFLFLDSHRHPAFTFDQYKEACLAPDSIVIVDDAQPIDEFEFGKSQFIKDFFDHHSYPYEIIETHNNGLYTWSSMVFQLKNGKNRGSL